MMDAPKSDVDRGREKSSTDFQVPLTSSTAGSLDDRVWWSALFKSVVDMIRSQSTKSVQKASGAFANSHDEFGHAPLLRARRTEKAL